MVSHRPIGSEAPALPRILTSTLSSNDLALKLSAYHRIGDVAPHPGKQSPNTAQPSIQVDT